MYGDAKELAAFHYYFVHEDDDTDCTAECLKQNQYPWDINEVAGQEAEL